MPLMSHKSTLLLNIFDLDNLAPIAQCSPVTVLRLPPSPPHTHTMTSVCIYRFPNNAALPLTNLSHLVHPCRSYLSLLSNSRPTLSYPALCHFPCCPILFRPTDSVPPFWSAPTLPLGISPSRTSRPLVLVCHYPLHLSHFVLSYLSKCHSAFSPDEMGENCTSL